MFSHPLDTENFKIFVLEFCGLLSNWYVVKYAYSFQLAKYLSIKTALSEI